MFEIMSGRWVDQKLSFRHAKLQTVRPPSRDVGDAAGSTNMEFIHEVLA